MGRAPCCEKIGLKKGPWTPEEDQKLINHISEHGHGSWRALPKKAGLLRCGKSCRLRWTNYLRPDIKRGKFSLSEEQTIIQLHALLGNRWSAIASHLPKRTDNEIKNYWNTHLKKRLVKMGIDPATHKPKMETSSSSSSSLLESNSSCSSSILSHMAQWESARLEAEARLARESKMRAKGLWPAPDVSSNDASSVKTRNSQESDLTSEPDLRLLAAGSSKRFMGAVDLMNAIQNWEKSLQGQAGMMWPGSLSSWKPRIVADGQDSSSCTSPLTDHGSPTSTLCSLEAHLQNAFQPRTAAENASFPEGRKLSWTDFPIAAHKSESFAGIVDGVKQLSAKSCHVDDVFQSTNGGLAGNEGSESLSGLHALQDLVFSTGNACTTTSPCSPSPWSQSSDDDLGRDVCKREAEGVPALASATTSSSLLGELELVSEDITSNKDTFSSDGCGEIPPEFLMDLVGGSKLHLETSPEAARPNTYSALLTEENPDYWGNMLKHLVDSPMQPVGNGVIPF